MTDKDLTAPERIWVDGAVTNNRWEESAGDCILSGVAAIEYIRADLASASSCPLGEDCDLTIAYMAGSADGRRKGWNDALEAAAEDIDCACPHKASVLECTNHNSRTRWEMCPEPNCAAIAAESVRALKKGPSE